jgi:clan AA aspartic protease
MLTGRVTPQWDAVVEVRVEAMDGRARAIQAAVDTGFGGFLSLPPGLVADLDLPMVGLKTVTLADGSQTTLFVFDAVIEWEGQQITVPAYEARGTPLIGMRLLGGSRLTVDVVEGGRVEIRPLAHA